MDIQGVNDQIDIVKDVEDCLPNFCAMFTMHNSPRQFTSGELQRWAVEAVAMG
jgi:hypothetical protein